MNVLLIGNGGREHSVCLDFAQIRFNMSEYNNERRRARC